MSYIKGTYKHGYLVWLPSYHVLYHMLSNYDRSWYSVDELSLSQFVSVLNMLDLLQRPEPRGMGKEADDYYML